MWDTLSSNGDAHEYSIAMFDYFTEVFSMGYVRIWFSFLKPQHEWSRRGLFVLISGDIKQGKCDVSYMFYFCCSYSCMCWIQTRTPMYASSVLVSNVLTDSFVVPLT